MSITRSHNYAPFKIEQRKVREFARSLGLTNPLYYDQQAAIEKGYRGVVAPPTFATVIDYTNQRDIYQFFKELNLSPEHVLHGEQEYEYVRDMFSGDTISAEVTIERVIDKQKKKFYYTKTIYHNQLGEPVLIARSTIIDIKGGGHES
ncbi:MaoC family dehydratase N-terminal domain-containing protein [Alkalihalophilus marmarensis]|jgi:acyl dehydratase|uniref:FAS1-like dehydratase domain-containing protein n=1 Tax=Alkalihalophilus marmarensis TaxID=521377 RepID=UPI00203D6FDA|nr:MaoC family dehydratase N-terminal domain-containing protein [Alkalihalophilus marmarensis]MCM3491610.1 MaoC family dehydratase N-terminal domain-containing protein [Alkalihalophilus marmarensis]